MITVRIKEIGGYVSSVLEIIEMVNGDIVLKPAGENNKPLLTIRFSGEANKYVSNDRIEVAKAMINAGIDALSELKHVKIDLEEDFDEIPSDRVLH
tara:strand:- start:53 stop:340 length:288 start_codon:yes stop_codon:yes gene_type:complete